MKRFYAIAILILSALTLRALQVDTVAMQQLIASGQRALCTAIEHNNTLRKAGATTGYRFFVTPDPPAQTNARVEFVGAQKGITIPQSVIDTLNARCTRDYVQFGVELFLIHINSLDVIVNGQMPQTVNLRDLLVNGLYDEQSNLDSLRQLHKEISSRIVSGVALSLNRTSLFYIVGDYCGVFTPTGKEGCWRYARVSSFAGPGQIGDHAGEFRDNLFRRVENIGSMLLPNRLLAVENEFRESMTVYNQRQLITSSFHPNFLNAIFENFDADAFADLTLEQRLHALHVYSGYPMLSAWLGANSEEHFVLQIIKTAPPDQAKGLLQGMEAPSTAIEGNNAYTGTKNGEALIYKLVDRTDDAVIAGPNNYQLLMKYVSATCTKSPQAIDYCVAATDVAQFNTVINWKNSYWLTNPPAGHLQYIVEFKTTGKISYKTKTAVKTITYVQGGEPVETTQWDESPNAVELSPFSFIILNNTSGLSMIGDVMNGPGAQMVPAVMLKYCADKQFNDQAITACAVALDIVGVVTGPGLITAALRAGRLAVAAFEAVQLLGAVGNLVANSSTSPNLQAVINKYNAIVGIWGLTRIATSGARYTADYFTAAKQNNLATISETAAQEYQVLYNTAKTDIDAAPEAVKGPLDKMKQLVGKGVSGGGSAIQKQRLRLEELQSQYGMLDFEGFTTINGLTIDDIPASTYNEMYSELSARTTWNSQQKINKITEVLASGTNQPQKVIYQPGAELFKVVKKGSVPSNTTEYWFTQTELDMLTANGSNFENKAGLPLGSMAEEYDIYKITAIEQTITYTSTIAPTNQRGYQTSGGAVQTIVLNRAAWTNPTKVNINPYIPNF